MSFNDELVLLGSRSFFWTPNDPIVLQYIIKDTQLLKELDVANFDFKNPSLIQCVSEEEYEKYRNVIRIRETHIFDPNIKQKMRTLYQSMQHILIHRLALDGEDMHIVREYPLDEA